MNPVMASAVPSSKAPFSVRIPLITSAVCVLCITLGFLAVLSGASLNIGLAVMAVIPLVAGLVYLVAKAFQFVDRLDFFSPLVAFPILYVVWFCVGSINLIDVPSGFSFGLFDPVPAYVLGYAALGLLAYLAGSMLMRRNIHGGKLFAQPDNPRQEFDWIDDRFWLVVIGLSALMLVSYALIVAGMGVPALDADAGAVRLEIRNYGPAEAVMFTCAWSLIPMLMLYVWQARPKTSAKIFCYAAVAIISFLLLSLGGRGYLFTPLLTTIVARQYGKQRFAIKKLILVGVTLFFALSFFGYLRDTSLSGGEFGEDKLGIPGPIVPYVYAYLYIRYPVATFRDITEIIPNKVPYQHGALSFGPLATFLPGRHEQSDMFFKEILGNNFVGAGQPATMLGPLYGDAGLPGIVAGLFLFGLLISRAYRWMQARPTAIRLMIFGWLMQTLLFSLFANLFPYITTLWIPLFWMAMHLFLRKPLPAREPGGITGELIHAQ